MNNFININRVEFMITHKCTSNCKHCSVAPKLNHKNIYEVDEKKLLTALEEICNRHNVESIMTFGGEPLIRAELVCKLHELAQKLNIKARHLITNGFFSKNSNRIKHVAKLISKSGITAVCISVDAFHQEFIDLKYVEFFAKSLKQEGYSEIYLHPAWVVNKNHQNLYNHKTNEILSQLSYLDIRIGEGNNISLNGNASKYLSEFYTENSILQKQKCGEMPYTNALDNIEFLTIEPNGDVRICKSFELGNLEKESIGAMLDNYNPYDNKLMKIILDHGVEGLSKNDSCDSDMIFSQSESLCSSCKKKIGIYRRKNY